MDQQNSNNNNNGKKFKKPLIQIHNNNNNPNLNRTPSPPMYQNEGIKYNGLASHTNSHRMALTQARQSLRSVDSEDDADLNHIDFGNATRETSVRDADREMSRSTGRHTPRASLATLSGIHVKNKKEFDGR